MSSKVPEHPGLEWYQGEEWRLDVKLSASAGSAVGEVPDDLTGYTIGMDVRRASTLVARRRSSAGNGITILAKEYVEEGDIPAGFEGYYDEVEGVWERAESAPYFVIQADHDTTKGVAAGDFYDFDVFMIDAAAKWRPLFRGPLTVTARRTKMEEV